MKKISAIVLGCIILSVTGTALANCYSCGRKPVCGKQKPSLCECNDPGRNRNSCMSLEKYCKAFGNPAGNMDQSFIHHKHH